MQHKLFSENKIRIPLEKQESIQLNRSKNCLQTQKLICNSIHVPVQRRQMVLDIVEIMVVQVDIRTYIEL